MGIRVSRPEWTDTVKGKETPSQPYSQRNRPAIRCKGAKELCPISLGLLVLDFDWSLSNPCWDHPTHSSRLKSHHVCPFAILSTGRTKVKQAEAADQVVFGGTLKRGLKGKRTDFEIAKIVNCQADGAFPCGLVASTRCDYTYRVLICAVTVLMRAKRKCSREWCPGVQ